MLAGHLKLSCVAVCESDTERWTQDHVHSSQPCLNVAERFAVKRPCVMRSGGQEQA